MPHNVYMIPEVLIRQVTLLAVDPGYSLFTNICLLTIYMHALSIGHHCIG